jgi:glycerol uptake facilitator-like aquaporin
MFQKYLVEFIGSLLFVYVILATNNPLAIGATLAIVLLLTSRISGGFLNPAVTIMLASSGKLPKNDVVPFCLSQVFGGLVALEIFKRYKF